MARWLLAAGAATAIAWAGWSFWPVPVREARLLVSFPDETQQRQLTLRYPAALRRGETGTLVLTVSPGDPGAANARAVVARLDLPGGRVSPDGETRQGLPASQPARYFWTVWLPEAGRFSGTAWLHLDSGGGGRVAVSAQPFEICSQADALLPLEVAQPSSVILAVALIGSLGVTFVLKRQNNQ